MMCQCPDGSYYGVGQPCRSYQPQFQQPDNEEEFDQDRHDAEEADAIEREQGEEADRRRAEEQWRLEQARRAAEQQRIREWQAAERARKEAARREAEQRRQAEIRRQQELREAAKRKEDERKAAIVRKKLEAEQKRHAEIDARNRAEEERKQAQIRKKEEELAAARRKEDERKAEIARKQQEVLEAKRKAEEASRESARLKEEERQRQIAKPASPQPESKTDAAKRVYIFKPTAYGTVEVFENGKRIATMTPSAAATQYGYQPGKALQSDTGSSTATPAQTLKPSVQSGSASSTQAPSVSANSGSTPMPAGKDQSAGRSTAVPLNDNQLRAILVNPKENRAHRQLAAKALGIDPSVIDTRVARKTARTSLNPEQIRTLRENSVALAPSISTKPQPNVSPATDKNQKVEQQKQEDSRRATETEAKEKLISDARREQDEARRDIVSLRQEYLQPKFAEPRKSNTQPVASSATKRVDSKTAQDILPYALLSRDAYSDQTKNNFASPGYQRDADWQSTLRRGGAGRNVIRDYEKSGFSAAIYKNDTKKEIVVAYRGSEGNPLSSKAPDWTTNRRALAVSAANARLEEQYVAAASLAARIQKLNPDYKITLTGHSLGGGLASYAGSWTKAQVITFNAAGNAYSTRGNNANQINVIVSGDVVGDSEGALSILARRGVGRLPGETVTVTSSSDQRDLLLRHGMDGIIGGISDAARGH